METTQSCGRIHDELYYLQHEREKEQVVQSQKNPKNEIQAPLGNG